MKHEYLVLVSVLAANLLIFQMPFVYAPTDISGHLSCVCNVS